MAWHGNFEEDRFRPDERGSWLSTLLLCVGSGSASKSSTRWGESSKRRGWAGEVRQAKTMSRGEMGEREMPGEGKKWMMQRGCKGKERVYKEMWAENRVLPLCALIWHIQWKQVITYAVYSCHAWLCAYIWLYCHLCSQIFKPQSSLATQICWKLLCSCYLFFFFAPHSLWWLNELRNILL